jgi:hypothetical protein
MYSGVVYPHAIEEIANGSVTFYPATYGWQYPDINFNLKSAGREIL